MEDDLEFNISFKKPKKGDLNDKFTIKKVLTPSEESEPLFLTKDQFLKSMTSFPNLVIAHNVFDPSGKPLKGKGKPRTRQGFGTTSLVSCPMYPPTYNAVPTYRATRRWTSNKTNPITSLSVTLASMHRQFSVVSVANTTAIPYADVWRIRRISIWCMNSVEDPTTVTLVPVGTDTTDNNFNDREVVYECTSRSEARPGHMAIVPSASCPLGAWHKTSTVNSTGVLFVINADYGGASAGDLSTVTMDIEYEFVENLYGTPQGYSFSLAGTYSVGTMGGTNIPISIPALTLQGINILG